MNGDLDRIAELLRKRFPRCEVEVMRSGDHGPNPIATVFFPSVGDQVYALGEDPAKGKTVYMGVNKHVRNEDFKPDGYELFNFPYGGPEHLVGKFVEGAEELYRRHKEFEDFEDSCDRSFGITERCSLDPRLSPELLAEVRIGEGDGLFVEWERETV